MYRSNDGRQTEFTDFDQAWGVALDPENIWVKLADIIPWTEIEREYAALFPSRVGNVAKSARMALGALIIKAYTGSSDRELVRQIKENPYYQYFLGIPSFTHKAPFGHAVVTLFRKRISSEFVDAVNNMMIKELEKNGARRSKRSVETTCILDATCAPQYIRYPQDYVLLNEARVKLEGMIDDLCKDYGFKNKPRTYRRVAQKAYVTFAKTKRRTAKQVRAMIRQQLGYVARDIRYLEEYMAQGYALRAKSIPFFLTILELYRQQKYMFDNKTHSVEHRIVSLSQPYVRPIVRGKARANVEFGEKIEVSVDENGWGRVEHRSFEPFNEGRYLQDAVLRYRDRTGAFPTRVLADRIYRTAENIAWCKQNGIRLSGQKLGRPKKGQAPAKPTKTVKQDNADRIGVERFFSLCKRCSGMGLVYTKLEETTRTMISISVLVTNLLCGRFENYFCLYFLPADDNFIEENEGLEMNVIGWRWAEFVCA